MDTEQLEQRHGLSLLQFFHKINNIIRVRSSVSVPIVEGPWCLIALHEGININSYDPDRLGLSNVYVSPC